MAENCKACAKEMFVLNQVTGICNHCGEDQREINSRAESVQQTGRNDAARQRREDYA